MPKGADDNADAKSFKALTAIVDPWISLTDPRLATPLKSMTAPDWQSFLACSRRHRVLPLVAQRIAMMQESSVAPFTIPPDAAALLQRTMRTAVISELGMLGEIRRLKSLFDSEGIAFLIVKGLTLSQRCFGGPGWRVNNDIDVLIRVEDLPRADTLLSASQYDRVQPLSDLAPEEISRDLKRRKDWVYVKQQERIILEVHHRLFDNVRLCGSGMMDRSEPLKLFGQVEVSALSPDDELPYLALHGAMHAWSRLKWLIDFAILLRQRSPEDIEVMLRQTKGGPAGYALHQGVALCWHLFTPDTPEPRMFRPRRTGILAAAGIKALTAEGSRELEDTRLGTTIKNASHYLLWSNPSYLISELGYDLTETSPDDQPHNHSFPIWLQRPVHWVRRRTLWKN